MIKYLHMAEKSKKAALIGSNIRNARLKTHLTQAEVAEKAGLSVNYYSRIERGEVNQSLETFEAVTRVLKVKSSDILPF